MKRQRIDLADLAAHDNLALAVFKAAQGKRAQPEVRAFLADLPGAIAALQQAILSGTAPQGAVRQFVILDPKRRLITAPCFADRVLHHAIFNLAEARLEQALADSAHACRPGRGVHAAVLAAQRGLQRWPWLVQVDVQHCFDSIPHDRLLALLARRFKGDGFLALLGRIVRGGGDAAAGRGLPIGALTSQHFANAYLDSADRLLAAHPGVGAVVRYMDDIVWFCHDRAAAQRSLRALQQHMVVALGLQLKQRVILRPCQQGLAFCGWRVRPGVLLAGDRKLRRYRDAAARLRAAGAAGVAEGLLQRAHDAALAALLPAQTLRWRQGLWWGAGL